MIVLNVLDNIDLFDIDTLAKMLTSKWSDTDRLSSDYIANNLWNIDMHRISSNFQQVITGIGLSGCSLLFSIGTFRTNSFLCYPVDCTKVIRFRTLEYFRFAIVGFNWWVSAAAGWHTTSADVGGDSRGPLLPPTTSSEAAVACPRRRRRGRQQRRRNLTPAADSDVCGATLQPTSAGFRVCLDRRMQSGAATFWAEH